MRRLNEAVMGLGMGHEMTVNGAMMGLGMGHEGKVVSNGVEMNDKAGNGVRKGQKCVHHIILPPYQELCCRYG